MPTRSKHMRRLANLPFSSQQARMQVAELATRRDFGELLKQRNLSNREKAYVMELALHTDPNRPHNSYVAYPPTTTTTTVVPTVPTYYSPAAAVTTANASYYPTYAAPTYASNTVSVYNPALSYSPAYNPAASYSPVYSTALAPAYATTPALQYVY
eukprot:NODE_4129_length_606_cov_637.752244_g2969_i0.p2 GENE.NODE_4129_length_606_cov_637.752244_g2969_i0~~NODE_4129_length_606_cov_637.752244_g2969_i0.p2  ORF type:complete len:156 (-),score=32.11 NODE_4129_length_606_cov_637.752244_g2969_i0:64-531(-)